MSTEVSPVKVNILDKEYRVACPENEKDALLRSANYLNTKMKEVRDTGKVIGVDRIAVMAALNIVHELLEQKSDNDSFSKTVGPRIKLMQDKINAALISSQQIQI